LPVKRALKSFAASIDVYKRQAVNWWLNERLLRNECSLAGIPIRIRQGFQENRILWTFSVPALISAFSVAPVLWLSSVMIVRSPHGFEQMALFAGADRWRLTILFIPTALFRSVLPMLANLHVLLSLIHIWPFLLGGDPAIGSAFGEQRPGQLPWDGSLAGPDRRSGGLE